MADKDSGLIGGDTGSLKQTESNRVLTYAAVSDMIDVNNTVLWFRGEVNTSVSSVSLKKVKGNVLSGKNFNGFIICSFMTDDHIGGGTLTGTIAALQNNHNYLTGVIFADYTDQTQAVFAAVEVGAANNYSMIYVVCKGNEAIEGVFADGYMVGVAPYILLNNLCILCLESRTPEIEVRDSLFYKYLKSKPNRYDNTY